MDDRNRSSLGGPRALYGAALTFIPVTQWWAHSMCEFIVRPMVYPDIGKETARTQRRFWALPMAFNGGRHEICTHLGWALGIEHPLPC